MTAVGLFFKDKMQNLCIKWKICKIEVCEKYSAAPACWVSYIIWFLTSLQTGRIGAKTQLNSSLIASWGPNTRETQAQYGSEPI